MYSYFGGGGRGGKSKRLLFRYSSDNGELESVFAWCTYQDYQGCDIQNDLVEGEKICITYVERPPKDYVFLYEIKRV